MAASRRPRLELLEFVRQNPSASARHIAQHFKLKPQTVTVRLHRAGYFKVWQKVQMPTYEGVRIR